MIELSRHIEILLLTNDCVIVPGMGGFMAHHVDARYDEQDGMFVPPLRTLGFNPQLKLNDSLLVQSYIEAYDISYPEALRRIEGEVAELRSHLETEGEYELNDIGVLRLNTEGNIEFEPCEAGILTPDLYGLSSFEMERLVAKAEVKSLADGDLPDEHAITIKMSWLRNALAVAAAVLAFLMIGTPVSNSEKASDVQQSGFINIPTASTAPANLPQKGEANPAEELTVEASPLGESSEEIMAQQETMSTFCIVMASQVSERNANNFVAQLTDKGFLDARVLVSGQRNIRRVVYGCFASEDDALIAQRELRRESRLFHDSWIMEVK